MQHQEPTSIEKYLVLVYLANPNQFNSLFLASSQIGVSADFPSIDNPQYAFSFSLSNQLILTFHSYVTIDLL